MAVEFHAEPEGKVLYVTVTGTLTTHDYERFVPEIDRLIKEHGKIRLLFEMHAFHGWTVGALWQDTKFAAQHFHDLDRLAVVGEKAWQKGIAAFCKPFTAARVRYFDSSERAAAVAWLAEEESGLDAVDEASRESFPASDPPAHTPISGVGPPMI